MLAERFFFFFYRWYFSSEEFLKSNKKPRLKSNKQFPNNYIRRIDVKFTLAITLLTPMIERKYICIGLDLNER